MNGTRRFAPIGKTVVTRQKPSSLRSTTTVTSPEQDGVGIAGLQVGVTPKSRPIQVATGSGIQTVWGRSRAVLGQVGWIGRDLPQYMLSETDSWGRSELIHSTYLKKRGDLPHECGITTWNSRNIWKKMP